MAATFESFLHPFLVLFTIPLALVGVVAGLWLTGAIGLSVAYMRYEIALVLSAIGFLIFQFSGFIKNHPDSSGGAVR